MLAVLELTPPPPPPPLPAHRLCLLMTVLSTNYIIAMLLLVSCCMSTYNHLLYFGRFCARSTPKIANKNIKQKLKLWRFSQPFRLINCGLQNYPGLKHSEKKLNTSRLNKESSRTRWISVFNDYFKIDTMIVKRYSLTPLVGINEKESRFR